MTLEVTEQERDLIVLALGFLEAGVRAGDPDTLALVTSAFPQLRYILRSPHVIQVLGQRIQRS